LGDQRRDGDGCALRNGDWRGRIEALCTVGLTASALVQKRSVRLPGGRLRTAAKLGVYADGGGWTEGGTASNPAPVQAGDSAPMVEVVVEDLDLVKVKGDPGCST